MSQFDMLHHNSVDIIVFAYVRLQKVEVRSIEDKTILKNDSNYEKLVSSFEFLSIIISMIVIYENLIPYKKYFSKSHTELLHITINKHYYLFPYFLLIIFLES